MNLIQDTLKDLGSLVGLKGDWVWLRATWNGEEYEYEETTDRKTWTKYQNDKNVISILYKDGPKDGRLEV